MDDFCDALLNKVKQDDFYTLLGCDELATPGQINAEFRQKAKLLHPDKNRGDRTTEKLFERLVHPIPNYLFDKTFRLNLAFVQLFIALVYALSFINEFAQKFGKRLPLISVYRRVKKVLPLFVNESLSVYCH